MFYRIQYKLTNTDMSNLSSFSTIRSVFCQLAVIPLLSSVLKCRDTTILFLAVLSNIIASYIVAFNSEVWVLYACYVLWMLNSTITTTSRSNLSKMMSSKEIGRAFSVLGLFQALLPVAISPAFAKLYEETLRTFPAAFLVVLASMKFIILALVIFAHFGMKRMEKMEDEADEEVID